MLKADLIQTLDDVEEILNDDQLTDGEKVDQLEDLLFEEEESDDDGD